MANLTVTDRNQFERAELGVPTTGVGLRSERGLRIYAVVSTVVLVLLAYAAAEAVSGWAAAIVLGVIALNAVGLMIAVNPARRA
jgi:hypothetical protein